MQINLSAKHMSLTPAIEEYARRKVEKLLRYFDRIQAVDVVIAKGRNDYTVEVRTDVERHDDFIALSSHEDLYACIDLTVDRSIRQLTDHKSRIRNHHHAPHHNGLAEKLNELPVLPKALAESTPGRAAKARGGTAARSNGKAGGRSPAPKKSARKGGAARNLAPGKSAGKGKGA